MLVVRKSPFRGGKGFLFLHKQKTVVSSQRTDDRS
nr:MAG TPA: hypothetical protein [Caudoviricetes sp.]DAS61402.1 MAG TPA: hypothetical protein [Caudoviricetes sp.]